MRARYWVVTVLVVVLLGVVLLVMWPSSGHHGAWSEKAAAVVPIVPSEVNVQKLAAPVDGMAGGLEEAFAAYNAGDYAKAIAAFGRAEKSNPESVLPPLYMGVSQLLVNDNAGAFASLQDASQFEEDQYQNDADWYLAIAALRTHSAEAQPVFHHICLKRGAAHAAEACAIEKRLAR
jgi:tetratricopeptide (TPR) repeat protein